MNSRELAALLWGSEAGHIRQDKDGRFSLTYDDAWRGRDDAVPLSLSMPLAAVVHGHRPVEAFLWGLLPDNEQVLDRWGRRFQVSARNPFALIAHVGEDCAGAIQFALPERVDALRDGGPPQVQWLTVEDVAARLRELREDQAAWRTSFDTGQFSLAGSQRKTALCFEDGRWGVPAGRTPTTHILKPPIPGLAGHVENEHFCLRLARAAGLPAATSEVRRFVDETAIVVTRYDRLRIEDLATTEPATRDAGSAGTGRAPSPSGPVLRLHQEDVCQALGVLPTRKYQNDGGPSPADIVELLRDQSGNPNEDVATFVEALAFNWLVGGTDAHAKNYSILHEPGGRPRLAPLYDLASILPYPDMDARRVRLAMRIGSEYRLFEVRRRHWAELAKQLRLDEKATIARVTDLAARVLAAVTEVREELVADGLDHPIVPRLADLVVARAEACLRELTAGGT